MKDHQSDLAQPNDNQPDVDKEAGKVQPIKLTPEQLERRKQSEPTPDERNTMIKEGQGTDQNSQ